ncbi:MULTISPECIES: AMP-binding protein [Streptococcus]|uniref:AMP-binding protein n=2 Tax=Streptococcus lactarius TaxID=684066 RepID=A0A9X1BC41_9STRE|nr:AMP-binding protein [Streptococcus lactarius]MBK4778745.1 hypothetical protein [Streptococcus lactarius]QUB39776.1 AMP-binding protein [Streptococcus lactarius]
MEILKRLQYHVEKYPNKSVLISKEYSLTFSEIENISNYIAGKIISGSVKSVIPFVVKDTVYVLPIVLGILKSGKIPLPLIQGIDFTKAIERVQDVDFDMVLTDFLLDNQVVDLNIFCIGNLNFIKKSKYPYYPVVSDDNLTYIICTSGTTGIPKKVFLTEDNICWLLDEFYKIVNFGTNSKFLFTTPYTFDVSLTEILAPVFTGGTLICIDVNVQTLKEMSSVIKKYSITHLSCPPSLAEMLLETAGENIFEGLQSLSIAGEEFSVNLSKKLKRTIEKGCEVYNFYGPSETTIYATYYLVKGDEKDHVPIGKPIPGAKIKVLPQKEENSNGGELAIGGKGVSRGYLLQPNLSENRFKVLDESRFYLSGDFVYYNENLDLVFEGRKDSQIKINGIRLEIEELNSIVSSIEKVLSTKIVYSNKVLYIFYKSEFDCSKLITESLPSYLKPKIIKVDEYLFTFNRKLDVKRMIEAYYNKKDDLERTVKIKEKDILNKINEIVVKYGVLSINELDSLDTVRFFLDIEEEFKIKIDSASLVSLNDTEKILLYIKEFENNLGDTKEPTVVRKYQKETDILNLKIKLEQIDLDTNAVEIPLTCTQKKLKNSPGIPIIHCEFRVNEVNTHVYHRVVDVVSKISKRIDLLRTFIVRDGNNVTFKRMEYGKIIPTVVVFQNFLSDDQMVNILKEQPITPVPVAVISLEQKIVRFYFFYHSIDASSLNMLSKMLNNLYEGTLLEDDIPISSFYNYINFINQKTSNIKIKDCLDLIPREEGEVAIYNEEEVFVTTIQIDSEKNKDVNIYSVFRICQHILKYQNSNNIVVSISYNFRDFRGFDASHTIGDVHTKIPIIIKRDEDYTIFENRFKKILASYAEGLDIRCRVFSVSPQTNSIEEKELLQRWNNISLSFNYIGEVLDPDEVVKNYREGNFSNRSVILFSNKEKMYYIMKGYCFK